MRAIVVIKVSSISLFSLNIGWLLVDFLACISDSLEFWGINVAAKPNECGVNKISIERTQRYPQPNSNVDTSSKRTEINPKSSFEG